MLRSFRFVAPLAVCVAGALSSPAQQPVQQPVEPARGALAQQPAAQAGPFQLNPAQQDYVDQVLKAWERESGQIKTFECSFEHLQYVVAIAGRELPLHRNRGELTYQRPDKGSFKVEEVHTWNNSREKPEWPVDENGVGEHYVCDGKKVYVYNGRAKQLEISPIPPELQGKQIVDGPLPFLFGAEAAKIKGRYWVRVTHSDPEEIWLEAYPKFADDAANYQKVEVILVHNQLLPKGIKVYRPNGDEDVYLFDLENAEINDPLAKFFGVFDRPRKPFGWDVIEHPAPRAQPPSEQAPHEARQPFGGPARY